MNTVASTNPPTRSHRESLQFLHAQALDSLGGSMPVRRNKKSFTQELREQIESQAVTPIPPAMKGSHGDRDHVLR